MTGTIATIDVDRSAEEVFAYATDPARFHEWQQGVIDGCFDDPEAPTVGTLCRTTRPIGGANRASVSVITRSEPPHTWGVRGTDGPIRATVDVTVEELSESKACLTIGVDFEGHGIGKALVPLVVRGQARKEMPGNLAALKKRLESTSD